MHLTNYAVNKRNKNFVFNKDKDADDEGSKWSHEAYRRYMEEHEKIDIDMLWKRIGICCVKV
jgi:hypothetical protein